MISKQLYSDKLVNDAFWLLFSSAVKIIKH